MSRWEPNARERLAEAALELFVERGYDNTTVAEIAERAGLTKRTFFRHFADKREVLFGGQEMLRLIFIDAISDAPASATPIESICAALEALGEVFGPERLAHSRRRHTVLAAHTELRERELLKSATLAAAIADGLRARGLTEPTVSVVAELGNLAFRTTFARWVDPANDRPFPELAGETLAELKEAAVSIGH